MFDPLSSPTRFYARRLDVESCCADEVRAPVHVISAEIHKYSEPSGSMGWVVRAALVGERMPRGLSQLALLVCVK